MIVEFELCILVLIDDMVEYVSDDEFFVSGYLCGYLMLVIVELESGDDYFVEVVYVNVS